MERCELWRWALTGLDVDRGRLSSVVTARRAPSPRTPRGSWGRARPVVRSGADCVRAQRRSRSSSPHRRPARCAGGDTPPSTVRGSDVRDDRLPRSRPTEGRRLRSDSRPRADGDRGVLPDAADQRRRVPGWRGLMVVVRSIGHGSSRHHSEARRGAVRCHRRAGAADGPRGAGAGQAARYCVQQSDPPSPCPARST